ncbi:hypothetical protein QQX98_000746 [Neonectria punicea]|uniref:2EXR domain-containing protein n=1 Tax=Neonectria punicea TaxID=979145 RepID=A0ABR1HSN3_9HYPO
MSTLLEPYDRDVHFPEFKYLPPEIRTQIWALALEYSRIVTFIPGHLFDDRQEYFKSSTPPPALMYVCSESRYITRNAYVNINNDDTTMPVFINPDFDKVYNPGDDLPEEYRDHIVAEGDAFMGRNIHHDYPVQVRAYFATSTPWPSSRYTLEYPCDFLSGVDGLGFNSVWIQKELEDSWFIYNLRLYEPLNAEDKKSTGETPINEQAKDGYKWCIRELKPTPRWEFIHNEIRPALQEPIAVDCILPDAIETSPTLRQELAELFVTTLD